MTPAEILRAAADKLDEGWTQGVMARDARGERVTATDPAARAWCAMGATYAVGGRGEDAEMALDCLWGGIGTSIVSFNDAHGRTKEEVQAAMRAAADQLESENG